MSGAGGWLYIIQYFELMSSPMSWGMCMSSVFRGERFE